MKSIMQTEKHCYVCGRCTGLELHHCIHGTANRRQADKYGLTVWLCADCHRGAEGVHGRAGHDLDVKLKKDAQERFEAVYGDRDAFRRAFGKSWL